jgi:excisionase family DNA binding protein
MLLAHSQLTVYPLERSPPTRREEYPVTAITEIQPAARADTLQDLNEVQATADYLHCGKTHVFHLVKTGKLASVKVGRKRLIPATAIHAYLQGLMT